MQERLLPVGMNREGVTGLVERVRQALGVPEIEDNASAVEPEEVHLGSDLQESIVENLSPAVVTNDPPSSRSASPRRLIKQVALESPPPAAETDDFCFRILEHEKRGRLRDHTRGQRDRSRRYPGHHVIGPTKRMDSWAGPQANINMDYTAQHACHADFNLKQSTFRVGDDCIYDRCSECGTIKEEYSDEELGLCIITLGTFIHREPALAAPLLPEILGIVTKVALNAMYPWQSETNVHLPGGAVSVAHQFLRCVLHQLAPNGIFVQMFQTHINDATRMQFFRSVAQALVDFNELNPIAPLQLLLEVCGIFSGILKLPMSPIFFHGTPFQTLNGKKSLPVESLPIILHNVACYLDCLPLEAGLGPGAATWSGLLAHFDGFFRRLVLLLSSIEDTTPLLRIMISILKVPGIQQIKVQYPQLMKPESRCERPVLDQSVNNIILILQSSPKRASWIPARRF